MGLQARPISSPVYGGSVSEADGGGVAPLGLEPVLGPTRGRTRGGHSPRKQGEKTGVMS